MRTKTSYPRKSALMLLSIAAWVPLHVHPSPLNWKPATEQAPSHSSVPQFQAPSVEVIQDSSRTPPKWSVVRSAESDNMIGWTAVPQGQEIPPVTAVQLPIDPTEDGKNQAATGDKAQPVKTVELPTLGGFRDLYRGSRWYPSISTIVPMGFGPEGLMAGIGFSGSDCTIESKQCIKYPNPTWESIQKVGEAVIDSYVGFGSSTRAIGVLVTQFTQDTWRSSTDRNEYFNGNQTGFAITRNLGPSTAIKLGAEGLIRWGGSRNLEADRPKSAFAVISQRFLLKPESATDWSDNPTRWFGDLYVTIGAGNGQFRPLDQVISAQIQSAKDAGCWFTACPPLVTRDAFLRGTEWGQFYPIGSLAVAITDQLNLITEWTGRNLNISFSWQPVREWGWTITPGIGSLVQNSEYGKNVNIPACPECDMGDAITTRPVLYLRSMINVRF